MYQCSLRNDPVYQRLLLQEPCSGVRLDHLTFRITPLLTRKRIGQGPDILRSKSFLPGLIEQLLTPREASLQPLDEFLLMIHPVVLGSGERLFGPSAAFELVDSTPTSTGVLIASYRLGAAR